MHPSPPRLSPPLLFLRSVAPSAAIVAHLAAFAAATTALGVTVGDSASLRAAIARAQPGQTIDILPGVYRGEMEAVKLRGTADAPITIRGAKADDPPVIRGGGTGLQLVSPEHVTLENIVFEKSAFNGLNIDDGGSPKTPAHHITLRKIVVRNVGTNGNDDGIKLSGVNDFLVEECTIDDWGREGQCIDMTGCMRGEVRDCVFDGRGTVKVGIQMKGGSSDIVVKRCTFRGITDRGAHLGGSTALGLFRPKRQGYEGKDLIVEDCQFTGAEAPIVYVGIDGAIVRNNVFYRPRGWIFRILQETVGPEFVPCRNGTFVDNIVVWRDKELPMFVDVGPDTNPKSFLIAGNVWYCQDAPNRSTPRGLPVPESAGVYGQDPQLKDPEKGDLRPQRSLDELRKLGHQSETRRQQLWLLAGGALIAVGAAAAWIYHAQPPALAPWRQAFRFVPDQSAFLRHQPAPPQRQHFAGSLFLYAGMLAVGSLWGWTAESMSSTSAADRFSAHPWGRDPMRNVDFISIALAYLPFGFLGTMALGVDRRSAVLRIVAAAAATAAAVLLSAAIEFAQAGVPGAAVSRNDVLAALLGCGGGAFAAAAIGQLAVDGWRRLAGTGRPKQPIDWLLQGYLVALVAYTLAPFDLTLHPKDVYYKLKGGLVQILPFGGAQSNLGYLAHVALFLPIGALAATAGTSANRPVRQVGISAFIGFLIASGLEFAQLFVRSRMVDATQVFTGTVGCVVGAWLMNYWGWQSALFSPLPTSNRLLQKARWGAALGVLAVGLTVLLAAWQRQ